MVRQFDLFRDLCRRQALVHVVYCLVVHELNGIAIVREDIADRFFTLPNRARTVNQNQAYRSEAAIKIDAADIG